MKRFLLALSAGAALLPAGAMAGGTVTYSQQGETLSNYETFNRSDLGTNQYENAYFGVFSSGNGPFPVDTVSKLYYYTYDAQGNFGDLGGVFINSNLGATNTLYGNANLTTYDTNAGTFTGTYTFTGGTGVYTGATGGGTITGQTFAGQVADLGITPPPLPSDLKGLSPVGYGKEVLSYSGSLNLPVVTPVPDTSLPPAAGFGTPFQFNVTVINGTPILIDPTVAVGYDYQIGAGDPLFQSVELPFIGQSSYDLYRWDGTSYVFDRTLAPGEVFTFAGDGVDRFRIQGIDTSIGLDPTDPNAFVTSLTFNGDGTFTGTMTPLTAEVAAVPLPNTVWLMASAMGMLLLRRRAGSPQA